MSVDPIVRKAELGRLIGQARNEYYNGATKTVPQVKDPTTGAVIAVTDEIYDAWVDELTDLDALSEMVTMVGAPATSEWPKTKHGIAMGSLNKVNDLTEITQWIMSNASLDEPLLWTEKLDGLSIHVKYRMGKFQQAITRGDGHIGEDISSNVAKMKGVPAKLPAKFTGSLRGEIILLRSDHLSWFPSYANPRNAASGIAKRYDGKGCEHLSILFYKVVEGEKDLASEEENFKFLQNLGLTVPNWGITMMKPGVRTPHDIWVEYQQTKRDKLDYDIDGLVIHVNNMAKQMALGEKDLRPQGSIAFKFASITRETTIRNILRQTGGTGRITPVAVFDPVNLLGATVSQASLYNWKYIRDLKIDVGAKVLVARANDVIPRVVQLVNGTGTVNEPPTACDVCDGAVVQEGEYHVCSNHAGCPAQVIGRLSSWISELNVLDFGDVLLQKVVEAGLVKTVPDLYRLKVKDIANLERLGEKTATKVLQNLADKSPLPLENFLGGLSIPGVATSTIKMVMDAGFDTLLKIRAMSMKDLEKVKGLGPVKAQTLFSWMADNRALLDDLITVVPIKDIIRGRLSGKTFCFTGDIPGHPRPELEQKVIDAGGQVKSSVSKKLSYLVMADENSTTTKAQAARKNGTVCINAEQLFALIEG